MSYETSGTRRIGVPPLIEVTTSTGENVTYGVHVDVTISDVYYSSGEFWSYVNATDRLAARVFDLWDLSGGFIPGDRFEGLRHVIRAVETATLPATSPDMWALIDEVVRERGQAAAWTPEEIGEWAARVADRVADADD